MQDNLVKPAVIAVPLDDDAALTAVHAHRWRIGAQDGPTSSGLCDCGAEQRFANSYRRSSNAYRPPGR